MKIKPDVKVTFNDQPRLISKPEMLRRVASVSFPTIWKLMRDGKFPRSRNLGGKAAWIESEVSDWIRDRPVIKLKGEEGAPLIKQGFAKRAHPRQKTVEA